MGIIPYTTCKTIKNTSALSLADGIYNINPTGLDPFEVYCLMDIAYDGGGWTLVGRSSVATTGLPFGWLSAG